MRLTSSPRGRDAARQELQLSALPRLPGVHASNGFAVRRRSPLAFFLLVFALSVPFWLVGAVAARQALPGLPVVDALIVVCPLLAASMLVYRENGAAGLRALLMRAFDYTRIRSKLWYVPAVLLIPAATLAAYVWMRVMELPLPTPHVPWLATPVLFLVFLIGAACEELGWTGYATDAMQARWSALETGILLGVMCAAWHITPLVEIHRSLAWIA